MESSPEEPFDYVAEGVKVEYFDLVMQTTARARAEDNPDCYVGFGGDVYIITYPVERGKLDVFSSFTLHLPS